MGQPVVLPKFELPGDKPHWAVRAAWIVGGLLLLSIVGLGAVIVHHRNLVTEAHMARAAAIAKIQAEAEAKVALAAAVAKAQKEAEVAAKMAAQAVPATTVPTTAVPEDASLAAKGTTPMPAKPNHAVRGRTSHGMKGIKTASKSTSKSEGRAEARSETRSERSSSSKPDPIDELLRKMK